MIFGLSQYWKPTPIKIRRIADAILAGCVFAASNVSLNGNVKLGTFIFVVGFIAKMTSNFFSNKPRVKPKLKLKK